ncbi:choice-of-anchor J domain-containing protein [Saprospira sp. CCB-QB6]|uniref:T9SS-dependent choice-of-anchor J family protein n=1 Tax=Saprospira sp. CCB-QB6 TaxID=3023936 RepID=UPI002349E323|nr:choice-of-anchor J domain-containing protein [Saprospira sp. CCB-QB6]WCL81233.1 choice-of-anchor J domain-containing protein [Saprospira sp. CCB-QB6]
MKKLQLSWLLFLGLCFSSGMLSAQLSEDFESSVPPTGWAIFDNGIGTAQSWQASTTSNTGSQAAYVRYENVTGGNAVDWMVTPAVAITSGNSDLTFYQKQGITFDYGSVFTIRVSTTSQTDTTTFTIVDTQVETDFTTFYTSKVVDLSAYVGQSIYVAFVMEQDDGDSWFIDDVTIGAPPCLDPSALSVSNVTTNSAELAWTSGGAAQAEIAIVPAGGTPNSGTVTAANPYTATGLTPATAYEAYVRDYCSAGTGSTTNLAIAGIMDGPLTGGTPKFVEVVVVNDVADLSIYGLSSANNGSGTTAGPEMNFPSGPATAGTRIYVASDSAGFRDYMGFDADIIDGTVNVNGDDAIELYENTTVIDLFGDVNVDGTGQAWEYLDGWAYRMGTAAPSATFNAADWTFSGPNANDGCSDNGSCASVYPAGSYTPAGNNASTSNWVGPVAFATSCTAVPAGDSIHLAIPINSPTFSMTGNTGVCYTETARRTSPDVWFSYVIPACTDSLYIGLDSSDFDTYLSVLAADGSTVLDYNDDIVSGTPTSRLELALSGNTDYNEGDTIYILVEGYSTTSVGNYVLDFTATFGSPAVGDSMSAPLLINGLPYNNAGNTACYTNTMGNASNDVWFQYIIEACTDSVFIGLDSSNFDTYLSIYAADSSLLDSDDNSGVNNTSSLTFSVLNNANYNEGDTIYILVEGAASNSGNYVLDISSSAITYPNDSASGATVVGAAPASFTGNTDCFNNTIGNAAGDAWFMYVIEPCTDSLYIDLSNSSFDTYLRIYAADASTLLDSDDDGGTVYRTSMLGLDITNDTTYNEGDTIFILVEGFSSNTGAFQLDISRTNCASTVDASVAIAGLMPTYCNAGSNVSGQVVIYNLGTDTAATVTYTVTASGIPIPIASGSATNIPAGDSATVTVGPFPAPSGNTTLTATISLTGDIDANNDTASFSITASNITAGALTTTNIACNGDATAEATAAATLGIAPYTYAWDSAAANQTTAVASNLAAGSYSVTVTDSLGCSDVATVTISEPAALVTTTTDNGDGTATADVTGGTSPYSYLWTNGSTSDTVVATGLQTVTVTDANGCQDSASVTIVVAVTNVAGLEQIQLYPNPADQQVTLSFDLTESRNLELQIVSIHGQIVYRQAINQVGQQSYTIPTAKLAPAMYTLRIIDTEAGTQTTQPLVIKR